MHARVVYTWGGRFREFNRVLIEGDSYTDWSICVYITLVIYCADNVVGSLTPSVPLFLSC